VKILFWVFSRHLQNKWLATFKQLFSGNAYVEQKTKDLDLQGIAEKMV